MQHSNTIYNLQLQKTIVLRMQPRHQATLTQPLPCVSQHHVANLHVSTHITTPEHQMTTVVQPFQCDLQAQIPKHPITTHTQAHPKQLEATVTLRQKKRQTDRSRTRPHRRGTFPRRLQPLYTEKHEVSCSGFLPKTEPLQHHAAIPMRSASTDSKTHPITTHTQAHPKAAWSHRYNAAKKKKGKPTAAAPVAQTRYLSSPACSHFTRKNTRFRAPASSPKQSPCNIMQPFQCDLQAQIPKHPITTPHTSTPKAAWSHRYTAAKKKKAYPNRSRTPSHTRGTFHRRLQPLYTEKHKVSCSGFLPKTEPLQHHAAIPMRSASTDSKTPYNYAHTSTPKAAWSHPLPLRQKKKGKPTAAAPVAHTRYLSSPAAATLHGKTQGFVLRLPPQLTTSLPHHFPSSPLPHRHHLPSSLLPFLTTSLPQPLPIVTIFPSSPLSLRTTSLRHHFPSSPLPFVTTSLRHHSPFIITSLLHRFPSSPLPSSTTSLPHHFPSSPLPFIITSSRSIS